MVLRLFKMIATSGVLTALECTKFVFGRGSARTPLGELTALPRSRGWFKGPSFKGEGKGEEGKKEAKGRGRKREGPTPLRKFLDPPQHSDSNIFQRF